MSKMYFVNIERANNANKMAPININISFQKSSLQPIDILI